MNDLSPDQAAVRIASRMRDIEPFHVMEVQRRAFELEAQGRRIVHMEIGQPDFPAPPQVIEAAVESVRREPMGYTDALGITSLREAIARFYADHHGVDVPPERILVTAGASGAFMIAMGTLIDAGDEVLMPDPCYPCNRHFVRMFEGRATTLPVDEAQRYQLTASDIAAHWGPRTRGALLATPSNPTGTMVPTDALREIISATHARGGFALVDEIYQGLTYEAGHPTALALSSDVFVVNSFSKYFNMTGWRLGWLVAPEPYVKEMERFAQNAFICVSAPAQYAALAAFRPDAIAVLEERRAEFQRRRDFMIPALRQLGFSIPCVPEGAFYIYAGCERFSPDSHAFAMRVLEEAGVAITPGCDFGEHHAERYVRFAYTRAMADLEEGVERIGRLVRSL